MVYYSLPEKPKFYYNEPEKKTTIICKTNVDMYNSVIVPKDCIKIEFSDYNSRDSWDSNIESAELTFHGVERDNPNYDKELKEYNMRLEEYNNKVIGWELEVKRIQKQNEENEKATYEKLKSKYGANQPS